MCSLLTVLHASVRFLLQTTTPRGSHFSFPVETLHRWLRPTLHRIYFLNGATNESRWLPRRRWAEQKRKGAMHERLSASGRYTLPCGCRCLNLSFRLHLDHLLLFYSLLLCLPGSLLVLHTTVILFLLTFCSSLRPFVNRTTVIPCCY
jgi:hypothetical protein